MSERYFAAYQKMLSFSNLEKRWTHASKENLEASLERTRQLLTRLGHPEQKLKFIHITGTSGKGSVTHLIHEILRRNGETVASYTSPHTTTYLERFHVNDKLPHPDTLAKIMEDVIAAHEQHILAGNEPLTFFELNTCNAFLLFQREKVEWCVLEVGMGGRYDATNVIPAPVVAIITNIDLDHAELIGPTKKDIAKEKSGIIKPGSMVVTGETGTETIKVIRAAAKKSKAPLLIIPNDTKNHLIHNADIARAAGLLLGITSNTINTAIRGTQPLPCRFEIMQKRPLVIVDGAHNAAKVRATVAQIKRLKKGTVHVIFGCKASKDAKEMTKELTKIAATIRTTRYTQGNGSPENPAKLLGLFPKSIRHRAYLFPHEALKDALRSAKKSDTILITGSLYLAGELRTYWRSEKTILRERQS